MKIAVPTKEKSTEPTSNLASLFRQNIQTYAIILALAFIWVFFKLGLIPLPLILKLLGHFSVSSFFFTFTFEIFLVS